MIRVYKNIISRFHRKTILVVGDLILDQHIQGSVSRISPEAPVPVVVQEKSFYSPGGAANVAHNLCALGAHVIQVGRIGDDAEGRLLKSDLKRKGINVGGVLVDKRMPTILKTRVVAHHQQIVRIDREKIPSGDQAALYFRIARFISRHIDEVDGIVISDYGKGLITPQLVTFIRDAALVRKKIITVDPKDEHFSYYRQVTAITPNRKEAENAIRNIKIRDAAGSNLGVNNDKLTTLEMVDSAGKALVEYLDLESLLITLGEHGMKLFERGLSQPVTIHTKAQEVFDVTGAGDAVISTFTLALAAGATKAQAADMANTAAGIVVGKMGAVAVTKNELLDALTRHAS